MQLPIDFLLGHALGRAQTAPTSQGGAGASPVPASALPPPGSLPMSAVSNAAAMATAPMQQAPQSAPPEAPADEIVVQNSPFHSRYKQGGGLLATLFPHTFADGSTGGNILGSIKDAFLVQAGRNPVYAPHMQQMREAEALEDYQSDPTKALAHLMTVNPGAALKGFGDLADQNIRQADSDSILKARGLNMDNLVRGRAASMLYAARGNPKAYPAALEQAKKYADRYGVDTSDFPQDVDSAQNWALGDVPVQQQVSSEDMRAYRDAVIQNQADRNRENARYHDATIGARNRSTAVREQHYNRSDATGEENAGSNRMRAEKYQGGGGRGGGATGASFKWDATKGKYVRA